MAESMSEEITKVMNEQKSMEETYARLITERSTLKGISNKGRRAENTDQITVSTTSLIIMTIDGGTESERVYTQTVPIATGQP